MFKTTNMNDYWIVIEIRTGRVIAHCGEEKDAQMLVEFQPGKRSYSRNKILMDQVIDVTSITDKQLPGQQGLPAGKVEQLHPQTIKLPEGQQEPVRV